MGLKKNLIYSILDGAFYSVMVGLGETYLGAFALAAGHSQTAAGLLSTLPLLLGGLIQLFTPRGVRKFKSYRKWVLFAALMQGLCFLPLAYFAQTKSVPLLLLYFVITVYWSAGMSTGPAWNAWLNQLIPTQIRTPFFSKRSGIANWATLFGIVIGGYFLNHAQEDNVLSHFAWMFLVCTGVRLFSVFCLYKQEEGHSKDSFDVHSIPLSSLFSHLRQSKYGKVLKYLLFFKACVYISSPFFTPYMLGPMKMSYTQYMYMLCAALLGRTLMMFAMTPLVRLMSIEKLMIYSTLGISALPLLWLYSGNSWYFLTIQIISGVCWGTFELSSFLILFDQIPGRERASVLSSFNFFNTLAMVLGSLLGAGMLKFFGEGKSAYLVVFGVSTCFRLIMSLIYAGLGKIKIRHKNQEALLLSMPLTEDASKPALKKTGS